MPRKEPQCRSKRWGQREVSHVQCTVLEASLCFVFSLAGCHGDVNLNFDRATVVENEFMRKGIADNSLDAEH